MSDVNRSFNYVGITQQSKARHPGPPPYCVFDCNRFRLGRELPDLGGAPQAPSHGGSTTHQGDIIFATWFTHDVDGAPLWLSVTALQTAAGVYSGQLIRTTGPPNAVPFNPALVTRTAVGTATFTFVNGNAATFAYTVNNVTQTKQITRQLLAPPAGTVCR